MRPIARPEPGEYAPYTTEYFDLVPTVDVLDHMETCLHSTPRFFRNVPDEILASLIDEYATVRSSTLSLFQNLPDVALTRTGMANGNPMSVRAAAFHIAGHEMHHLESAQTNYLSVGR